jgi:ENTH domain
VSEIIGVLEKRINDQGKRWRHIMKALTVFQFLVYEGSGTIIQWLRSHIYLIKSLCEFRYADSRNIDQGGPIRRKARALSDLIQDPAKLQAEKDNYARIRQEIGKPGIVDLHTGTRKPSLGIVTSRMTLDLGSRAPHSPTITSPNGTEGTGRTRLGGGGPYRPSLEGRYSLSLPLHSIEEEFNVIGTSSGELARIASKSEQDN